MRLILDQQKRKHQLFHVSISLAISLVIVTYVLYKRDWTKFGSLWTSLIVPIVLVGEILKVVLARYYKRVNDGVPPQKQRQKRAAYFTPLELIESLLVQFFCIIIFAFLCFVLGAPVLQSYEQTFVLALVLTLMTVSPTVFLLGGGRSLQVCFCEKPEFVTKTEETALDLFKYNAVGAVLGAWTGSVVLPLDWDCDWQVYPIPNVVGALLGSALGSIFACSLLPTVFSKYFVSY